MAEGDQAVNWAAMREALGRAFQSASVLEGYAMPISARITLRRLKRALVDATLEAPTHADMTSVLWAVDAISADAVTLEMLQAQAGSAEAGVGFAAQIMRAAEDQPEALDDGEETDGEANRTALAADADDEASESARHWLASGPRPPLDPPPSWIIRGRPKPTAAEPPSAAGGSAPLPIGWPSGRPRPSAAGGSAEPPLPIGWPPGRPRPSAAGGSAELPIGWPRPSVSQRRRQWKKVKKRNSKHRLAV